ncbi:hypothetical protein BH11CYA1_BH11CYA1_15000 [soil metagenome]
MFDKLKNIKTPHGNPFTHLRNMFGYFLVGALLTVLIGLGVQVGSVVTAVLGAALAAAIALLGGILVTMIFRTAFKLVQTGRILQYGGFWLACWLGLEAAAAVFSNTLALSNGFLASLAFFAIGFGAATVFGQVPWRGRSWMPIRRP